MLNVWLQTVYAPLEGQIMCKEFTRNEMKKWILYFAAISGVITAFLPMNSHAEEGSPKDIALLGTYSSEQKFKSHVLRIAKSLPSATQLESFLQEHGFSVALHDSFGNWPTDLAFTVHATCKLGKSCPMRITGLRYIAANIYERSLSVSIRYNESKSPIGAETYINWE